MLNWCFDYFPLLSIGLLLVCFYWINGVPEGATLEERAGISKVPISENVSQLFNYIISQSENTKGAIKQEVKTTTYNPGLYKIIPWLYHLPPRMEFAVEDTLYCYVFVFIPWFLLFLKEAGVLDEILAHISSGPYPDDADRNENEKESSQVEKKPG